MEKGYKNIFWGVFLATFNLNLGFIKIVPAFVGWMVVLSGINCLKESHDIVFFHQASKYNGFLIAFSILGSVLSLIGGWVINNSVIFSYYPIIIGIFEILMVFYILEGSIDHLKSNNEESLSLEFEEKQRSYIILEVIQTYY